MSAGLGVAPREHVDGHGRKVVMTGFFAVVIAVVIFVWWLKRGRSDDD